MIFKELFGAIVFLLLLFSCEVPLRENGKQSTVSRIESESDSCSVLKKDAGIKYSPVKDGRTSLEFILEPENLDGIYYPFIKDNSLEKFDQGKAENE